MSQLSEMERKFMEQSQQQQNDSIFFAVCAGDIVAVRVVGRGTHVNSPALQEVADRFLESNAATRFIIDLAECPSMDSTFMGTLAGITLRQRNAQAGLTILLHTNEQNRRLLDVLGLSRVLEFREESNGCQAVGEFLEGRQPQLSKMDRTLHMIAAHERLVNVETENEVRFQGVLESLRESLDRERQRQ